MYFNFSAGNMVQFVARMTRPSIDYQTAATAVLVHEIDEAVLSPLNNVVGGQLAAFRAGNVDVGQVRDLLLDLRSESIAGGLLEVDQHWRFQFAGQRQHRHNRVAVSGRVQVVDDQIRVLFSDR